MDFDRLNDARALSVVVSAVNVRTGNFTRFDNRRQRLGAEHFMASGALPPGLPPILIEGEYYWDGGVVSNTPLYEVLQDEPGRNTLVLQVDLGSARGALPHDVMAAAERRKEIQYSSRTRFFTEFMRHTQEQRRLVHDLMALVPEAERGKTGYRRAEAQQSTALANVIHLLYTDKSSAAHFRDFKFSMDSMRRHWQAGLDDMRHTLSHHPADRAHGISRHNGMPRLRARDLPHSQPSPVNAARLRRVAVFPGHPTHHRPWF